MIKKIIEGVFESQKFVRKELGQEYAVSLREVDRFKKLFFFFVEMIYQKLDLVYGFLNKSKDKLINDLNERYWKDGQKNKIERAAILTFSVVYLCRLED